MMSAILASLPFATAWTPPGEVSRVTTISCGRRNLMSMFSRKPTRRRAAPLRPPGRDSTIVNLYGPVGVSCT
jgi:hypothetical protein